MVGRRLSTMGGEERRLLEGLIPLFCTIEMWPLEADQPPYQHGP